MLQFILFVLIIENILTACVNAKSIDYDFSYIDNLMSYSNGKLLENNYKPDQVNIKLGASPYDKTVKYTTVGSRRLFDIIKKIFFKKELTLTSTTSTADPNPVKKGLLNHIPTSTPNSVISKTKKSNWFSKSVKYSDDRLEDRSNKSPEILTTPIALTPNLKNNTGTINDREMKVILYKLIEVLSELKVKLQEITQNNGNREKIHLPFPDITTNDNSDVFVGHTMRYRRQIDNNDNIPIEVKQLSVENDTTGDSQNVTIINDLNVRPLNSYSVQNIPKIIKMKIGNESHENYSINLTHAENLNLSNFVNKFKKSNVSVNAYEGDSKLNDSNMFKIRIKRKVNDTGHDVLSRAVSEKPLNVTDVAAKNITNKIKITNHTKYKNESKYDSILVTSKPCNESNQVPNGRRSGISDKAPSEVKQKLLQYMEETFAEIFVKIQPLDEIKRTLGTQDMYRVGYITANLDTLEVNLRNLKTELESNKDLWSEMKIMDIFDKIMQTNKIVSNLLTALNAFSLHGATSPVQPYAPYSYA